MAINTGDTVGDYRVIDFAGSGGMGTVYKIEHLLTRRIEAMKLLPIGIGSQPDEVQRFEREIQVQARLHHPNIAALYNAVRDGHSIALIMEYVEGESLQRMLERGPLPLPTAVHYAVQILNALGYAHQAGVVHRDVAPANILITPDGTAKLTDFGLARAVTDLRLTTSGVAVGSPWYMSPEQVRAVDEIDERADLYSMGAVLHEMLTGRKLFDADGSFAIMNAQLETVPQPPSAHNLDLPKALDEVVSKSLAKDPAARFQSAAEFREGIEVAVGRMQPAAEAPSRIPVPTNPQPYRARAVIALMVAAAALGGMFGTVVLKSRNAGVAARAGASPVQVSQPAPPQVTDTPAPQPAPATQIEAAAVETAAGETAKVAPRPAAPSARPPRRTGRPDPSLAIRVTGGVVEPSTGMPPSNPPRREAPKPAAETAPEPEPATAPETPAAAADTPRIAAEPEGVTAQSPEEVKPAKTGNRFIRALGKLNPFSKGARSPAGDPAKAAAKQN